MPDLLAGTTVNALDTPPTVEDFELGQFTFTHTTYATTGEPGTAGVAFTAPTTGRVLMFYGCGLFNSAANTTGMTIVVREGTTVGSGTTFLAASDDNAIIINSNTTSVTGHRTKLVTGLTPGASYNVRLEHRVTAGTGTMSRRHIDVLPVS